jgi:hypothetical protein
VSAERIMMAIGGDLTKSAQQYDLMDEVVKNLTGFGVRKQDPASAMRFKMGGYAGEIARARNAWTLDIVNASNIQKDIEAVAAGNKPITIATEFENLQSNNYRVMSNIYKDVKNLRILNFTEKEIKDIIKARRAVSKQDLNALMLGLFNSEGYANTLKNKKGGLNAAINNLNRTLGTFYTYKDLVDTEALKDIKNKYNNIPLGLSDADREKYLKSPSDFKYDLKDKAYDKIDIIKQDQETIDEERSEEYYKKKEEFELQQELKKEELKNKSSQAPASMTLPKLDNTMMAGMTAGTAANIDPTTNLTTTETALLSPLEQAYYTNKRRV